MRKVLIFVCRKEDNAAPCYIDKNDNPERACAFGMDWRSKALGSVVKTYVAIGLLEMHFTANGTRWGTQTLLQQAFRVVRLASIWA